MLLHTITCLSFSLPHLVPFELKLLHKIFAAIDYFNQDMLQHNALSLNWKCAMEIWTWNIATVPYVSPHSVWLNKFELQFVVSNHPSHDPPWFHSNSMHKWFDNLKNKLLSS